MVKCVACGKFLGAKEGVSCPKCKSRSHNECVRVPIGVMVDYTWRCGDCQSKAPKGRDPSTPVTVRGSYQDQAQASVEPAEQDLPMATSREAKASQAQASVEPAEQDLPIATSREAEPSGQQVPIDVVRTLREEMRSQFANIQNLMTTEFKSSKDNMSSFLEEMRELKRDLTVARSSFNERMDAFDARLLALEIARDNPVSTDETNSLEQALVEVKLQLNEREQEHLLNDVVITGFPEQKGENSAHLASLLGTKMGISLDERDIVLAEREGAPRRAQDGSTALVRARRIIVRFARRATRDEYLQSARVRRGLTTAELSVEGAPARIYVNERLTKLNGQLFAKAREYCRTRSWKYCWSKEGRIYVRKEHGSPYSRVRNEMDLDRIFPKCSV